MSYKEKVKKIINRFSVIPGSTLKHADIFNLCEEADKELKTAKQIIGKQNSELDDKDKLIAEYGSGLSINSAIKILESFDMLEEAVKLHEITTVINNKDKEVSDENKKNKKAKN